MFAAPGKTGCLIRNASIYGVVSVPRLTALLSRNTLLCILWICSRYVDENLFFCLPENYLRLFAFSFWVMSC